MIIHEICHKRHLKSWYMSSYETLVNWKLYSHNFPSHLIKFLGRLFEVGRTADGLTNCISLISSWKWLITGGRCFFLALNRLTLFMWSERLMECVSGNDSTISVLSESDKTKLVLCSFWASFSCSFTTFKYAAGWSQIRCAAFHA